MNRLQFLKTLGKGAVAVAIAPVALLIKSKSVDAEAIWPCPRAEDIPIWPELTRDSDLYYLDRQQRRGIDPSGMNCYISQQGDLAKIYTPTYPFHWYVEAGESLWPGDMVYLASDGRYYKARS